MTTIDTRNEEYWSRQFHITNEDLDLAAGWLGRASTAQDLKAIALPILKARLEHGADSGLAAPSDLASEAVIRIWDPAAEWEVGDGVLLVHDRFGNSKYEVFLGEITHLDHGAAEINIAELHTSRTFPRTLPGTENARTNGSAAGAWRALIVELVKQKLGSGSPEEQAEGLLLEHGESILTRLAGALRQNPRFTSLMGRWALRECLPRLDPESLQVVHHFLLQNQGASLDDIMPVLKEHLAVDVHLLKMAVQVALQAAQERFEDIGTAARPQWKARLPAHDQAQVTHFAFDPQTFEILCSPGQRLSQKRARRLQELDLYAHVVTFAEWRRPAGS